MALCTLSEITLATGPLNKDFSLRSSSIFKNHSISLHDKSWISSSSLYSKSKIPRSRNQYKVRMSVQPATQIKADVPDIGLEVPQPATKIKTEVPDIGLEVPENIYDVRKPYTGIIISSRKMVGPRSSLDIYNVLIDHGGNLPYWEGQNYGVLPPGGGPNDVRLFSLASSRYGDLFNGKTATLCVRRTCHFDCVDDHSVSSFLCDSKPGDKVQIAGPTGKTMLLPVNEPNATHIMIGTSTGIAPYRGYLRRMFRESIPNFKFTGQALLFFGADYTDGLLYDEEFTQYAKHYPDQFQYVVALSEEKKTSLEDKIIEWGNKIFDKLDCGAHIYICGNKPMLPGILEALRKIAEGRGESWEKKLSQLKINNKWHALVY